MVLHPLRAREEKEMLVVVHWPRAQEEKKAGKEKVVLVVIHWPRAGKERVITYRQERKEPGVGGGRPTSREERARKADDRPLSRGEVRSLTLIYRMGLGECQGVGGQGPWELWGALTLRQKLGMPVVRQVRSHPNDPHVPERQRLTTTPTKK